jgi:hypothetical protein
LNFGLGFGSREGFCGELELKKNPQTSSLEQEWIELTQLRLLLVSLIKILLSAISWNLRETGVSKKWGMSEKPVKWLMLS